LAAIWADRPVAEIDGNDIHVVVSDARKRGIPGLGRRNDGISETRGRRLHAALSVLFRWLMRQRKIASNPCATVDRPPAPADRERVLTPAEIVTFWNACEQLGPPFGALFQVLLLTGARLHEVTDMTRGEIGADGVWTIPGSRTKNHRPLALPLPPWPRQIIDAVPAIAGATDLVFTTNGTTPVSGFSKTKRRLDTVMAEITGHAVPAFRLHDLRRTAATGMAELGVALPVVEKILNHVSGSFAGIVSTYQKYEYRIEKAEALLRWSQHVAGLVEGKSAKVTPLRKSKGA
jgi:integrase